MVESTSTLQSCRSRMDGGLHGGFLQAVLARRPDLIFLTRSISITSPSLSDSPSHLRTNSQASWLNRCLYQLSPGEASTCPCRIPTRFACWCSSLGTAARLWHVISSMSKSLGNLNMRLYPTFGGPMIS